MGDLVNVDRAEAMTRYPVGPKQKSMGETSHDVPPPMVLNLALAINCLVLLAACFLMLFLHSQNLIIPFSAAQSAGIAMFGLIGSAATIWAISASRHYSRLLVSINTLGISGLCLSFYFGD